MKQELLSQMRMQELTNITQGHTVNELWRGVPVINFLPLNSHLLVILKYFSLPAGLMLNFVSRGHWSDTRGSRDFLVPVCVYFFLASMALGWPVGCLNGAQLLCSQLSHKFQQHLLQVSSGKLCRYTRGKFIMGGANPWAASWCPNWFPSVH